MKINHEQNVIVIKKLSKIFGNLEGLKIAILGLTYKAGTNTLRRSTALEIITELLEKKVNVNAYDPTISSLDLINNDKFHLANSVYPAVDDASAILIFTDWSEFREVDYHKLLISMKKPSDSRHEKFS